MTPELPRAPMSDPWAMALHTVPISSPAAPSGTGAESERLEPPSPSSSASSATTDSRVRAMLVPVSPSGTG